MKKKELTDLRGKSVKDLVKLAAQKSLEAKKAKMEMTSGKQKNLKTFRNLRKDVAQILSLAKEKEIIESLEAKKETKKEEKK